MADREIWIHANSNTVWLVAGNTRKEIPATSGGISQANMINALLQTGAVDKRSTYYPPASIYALEAMKNIT